MKTLLPDRLNRWIGRLIFAVSAVRRYMREGVPEADSHVSFSQEGEDMILRYLLGAQAKGFYVDVGAHHPTRFSNTCVFYRRGWTGINIDADGEAVKALARERPNDVNLALGVGAEEGQHELIRYSEPALNTLDARRRDRLAAAEHEVEVIGTERVMVKPLREILNEHLPQGQEIDVMSVDVEGQDLEVLHSNDWDRFRPKLLLVECVGQGLADVNDTSEATFLATQGYRGFAKTVNTVIFQDTRVDDLHTPEQLRSQA